MFRTSPETKRENSIPYEDRTTPSCSRSSADARAELERGIVISLGNVPFGGGEAKNKAIPAKQEIRNVTAAYTKNNGFLRIRFHNIRFCCFFFFFCEITSGTNTNPGYSFPCNSFDFVLVNPQSDPPTGITILPPTLRCFFHARGMDASILPCLIEAAAAATIPSNPPDAFATSSSSTTASQQYVSTTPDVI